MGEVDSGGGGVGEGGLEVGMSLCCAIIKVTPISKHEVVVNHGCKTSPHIMTTSNG